MSLPQTSISDMDAITLSKYDDLICDILLDQANLWFITRKMLPKHRRPRVPVGLGLNMVRRLARGALSLPEAVEELTKVDYIAAYLRHKSQERYQDFCLHAARYFSMYLSDAGYEVGMTARYKSAGGQPEACVIATRPFTAGSIINLCSGSIARLDEGDLARLEREKADFSVMWWSKKRHMCLFLGPARFVNHDCDSNCRFTALGSDAICFQVLKNIKPGQEITTHYGHNYFGANNCECLCASCEKYGRGGFAKGPVSPSRNGIIKDQPGSPPRIRTRNHGRRRVLNSGEPCCRTCKEPLSAYESIIATTSGGGRSGDARECPRCERHFVIFGLPWPDRPEIQARRKKPAAKGNPGSAPGRSSSSSLRKRKLQAQRPDEFATSIYNDGNGINADSFEMFSRRAPGTPVFVDPLDPEAEIWWPAVIVGNAGERLEVCYFEDNSYSECRADEIRLFSPFAEPFTRCLEKSPHILDYLSVRRAICYYEWRFLAPVGRPHIPLLESPTVGRVVCHSTANKAKRHRHSRGINGEDTGCNSHVADSAGADKPISGIDDDRESSTTIVENEAVKDGCVSNSPSVTATSVNTIASAEASCKPHGGSLAMSTAQIGINEIVELSKNTTQPLGEPWILSLPPLQPENFFFREAVDLDSSPASGISSHAADQLSRRSMLACIEAYDFRIGDDVIVLDSLNLQPYRARIEDIDVLDNEARRGFYYYVHFMGWNRRFDEWVSPCRVASLPPNLPARPLPKI